MILTAFLIKYKKKIYTSVFRPAEEENPNIIAEVEDNLSERYLKPQIFNGGNWPNDKVCFIDKRSFIKNTLVIIIPVCKHIFHPECIKKHIETNKLCPICNTPIGEYRIEE